MKIMKWIVSTVFLVGLLGMQSFGQVHAGEDSDDMALIPAGEFLMGSPEGVGSKNEYPAHKVYLDAFHIDRYEVTFSDFEKYMDANPKVWPTITGWYDRKAHWEMINKPIFGLTWKRCREYCAWRGKRLLTEAEWERAAAGTEDRAYPWGNEPPTPQHANFGRCCFIMRGKVLFDIGSLEKGKTPEGVYDLAGNVAEWVYDWYDAHFYKKGPRSNPKGADKGKYHTIRGGAWNSLPVYLRSSSRYGFNDAKDYYGIGCRCAKSAQSAPSEQ